MATGLRTSVRFPADTRHFLFSTAFRYDVGTTQLSSPGLVNFKPHEGCTHRKGGGELESPEGRYLHTVSYATKSTIERLGRRP
jgi:hypothetical protein